MTQVLQISDPCKFQVIRCREVVGKYVLRKVRAASFMTSIVVLLSNRTMPLEMSLNAFFIWKKWIV